jgi:hypothetical protein
MSKCSVHTFASALIAAVLSAGPALAQQGGAKSTAASDQVREKCRAQVRAMGIRGMGGTAGERHRSALMQQCIAKGGTI